MSRAEFVRYEKGNPGASASRRWFGGPWLGGLLAALLVPLFWTLLSLDAEGESAPETDRRNETAIGAHPLDPAIKRMRDCQLAFTTVRDYTATFIKQVRVNDSLLPEECISAKFMPQPHSVYFKWIEPDAGREAIYVDGKHRNMILVHTGGIAEALAGTIEVDPEGSFAMQTNRKSIREAGIGKIIATLIKRWEYERQFQETVVRESKVKVNGRPCLLIETVHPGHNNGKFEYHTLRVYIDAELNLPIRLEGYGFPQNPGSAPGPILEAYTFLDLKLNQGLSSLDFSPKNPEYNFPSY